MIDEQEVYHFDIYADFSTLLSGRKFAFPLREETLKKIPHKKEVKAITVKSSSLVTALVLAAFPQLSLLVTRTVGTDHIDLSACRKAGITFKNIPAYGSFAVAEHGFALLLALTRKIITLSQETKQGKFHFENGKGMTLEGKTLGVIGAGRIGLETIRLGQAFKMKVVAFDMYTNPLLAQKLGFQYVSLPRLLSQADVISLSIPLTDKTQHLIGKEEIRQMKDGVVLINTSRGEIIDTAALIKYIKKFRYLGLDVVEHEADFNKQNPLLRFPNVLITPHCAFFTDKTVKTIAEETQRLIHEHFGVK